MSDLTDNSHSHASTTLEAHEHDTCCGHSHADDHDHGHSHSHADGHNSQIVALGIVTPGGATFAVDREGQIEPGKTTTFQVELLGNGPPPRDAWLEDGDGQRVCEPAFGEGNGPRAVSPMDHFQYTLTPTRAASKFVLRVGKATEAIDLAAGAAPCNGGILAPLHAPADREWKGFVELKLHDDGGDLELWLYAGVVDGTPAPFDVPQETVVRVSFPFLAQTAEMRIRNGERNEDEAGTASMRDGRTNYFIFPGESGADAAWLQGGEWSGVAVVTFETPDDGKSYGCEPLVLVPHAALCLL